VGYGWSRRNLHDDEDAKTVKQTLATFLDLQLKYDADAVAKMLDDAFLYVSPEGSLMSRAEFIKLTNRERNPLDILEVTDVQVRVSGNTAVATGLIHEKGLLYGKPYEFRGRTLLTYVKKGNRWLQLACHD
jgi:ketosteroid isomerase-like protein